MASQEKVEKLGDGAVPPTTSSFVLDEETTIDYYTKPLDKVLENKLIDVLEVVPRCDWNNLHLQLSVGGDHGQGSFQFGTEVVLQNKTDGSEHWKEVVRLAEIDCKKDTFMS